MTDKNYTATAADTDLGAYIQARLDQWNMTADQAATDHEQATMRISYWAHQKDLYERGELDV